MALSSTPKLFVKRTAGSSKDEIEDTKVASIGRHCRSYDYPEFDEEFGDELNRRKKRAISIEQSEPNAMAVEAADSRSMAIEPSHIELQIPTFVGNEVAGSTVFGFLFPNRSFPLNASNCCRVNSHAWELDMTIFVGEAYSKVEEICIYLLNEKSLPADKAVAVYVQAPGSSFQYCGAVYQNCPSAVLALMWPDANHRLLPSSSNNSSAKIGISVEDLSSLPVINMGVQKNIEGLALKMWEKLFNIMSGCTIEGDKLMVPKHLVDRRFQQFKDRSKKDPEYLKSFAAICSS
ncbi:protein Hikeshi [Marchantia polymorpha subsp. ruderalis]